MSLLSSQSSCAISPELVHMEVNDQIVRTLSPLFIFSCISHLKKRLYTYAWVGLFALPLKIEARSMWFSWKKKKEFLYSLTGTTSQFFFSTQICHRANWAATCDFKQCGILTWIDSRRAVQPPFKLRNSKWCSVSSLTVIEYSSDQQRLRSDCAYAQADLRLCWSHIPHWSKSQAVAQLLPTVEVVVVFLFNYLPTAKIIWGRATSQDSKDSMSWRSNLWSLDFITSGFSTTPKKLID